MDIYDTVSAEELLSGEYNGEYVLLKGVTSGYLVRAEVSDDDEYIDTLLEDDEYFGDRIWHVLLPEDAVSLLSE